mmetsp:Transcript_73535/g.129794  ORF Transcript_73535/g.129794 Transcript_73535/m.129794 type:complete len:126 (-) Transcript_73535:16-393(-)
MAGYGGPRARAKMMNGARRRAKDSQMAVLATLAKTGKWRTDGRAGINPKDGKDGKKQDGKMKSGPRVLGGQRTVDGTKIRVGALLAQLGMAIERVGMREALAKAKERQTADGARPEASQERSRIS